jgi:hypothetical protein
MSTRESMRRELKELAKLAETMRKESEAKASADLYAYEAAPEQPGELALTTSSVTVPPVVPPSVPPPDDAGEVDLPVLSRGRGRLAVFVGVGLAAALVGGAALGRSFASQRAAAHTPAPVVAAAAVAAPLPAQPADPPAPPPAAAAAAPAIESTIVAPAPTTPPAPTAASPATPRRRTPGPGLRRFAKPGPAKGAAAAAADAPAPAAAGATDSDTPPPAAPKPAAAAKPANAAPQTTSGDSLEDMIRKAVAAPAKK